MSSSVNGANAAPAQSPVPDSRPANPSPPPDPHRRPTPTSSMGSLGKDRIDTAGTKRTGDSGETADVSEAVASPGTSSSTGTIAAPGGGVPRAVGGGTPSSVAGSPAPSPTSPAATVPPSSSTKTKAPSSLSFDDRLSLGFQRWKGDLASVLTSAKLVIAVAGVCAAAGVGEAFFGSAAGASVGTMAAIGAATTVSAVLFDLAGREVQSIFFG